MAAIKLMFLLSFLFWIVYVFSSEHGDASKENAGFCTADTLDRNCGSPETDSIFASQMPNRTGDLPQLLIFTVATRPTDGFKRFMRNVDNYGYDLKVLGMNEEWKGGDITRLPGGGHKVNLLRAALEEYKTREDLLVMFVDSYDVIITASPEEIIERFKKFEANVVFSAEGFCWPDKSLASMYPPVVGMQAFLNSGGFIGKMRDVYAIVTSSEISDSDDDQLFYTHVYLDEQMRKRHMIKLDHESNIFQNLNGAQSDVELHGLETDPVLFNRVYNTYPIVIHGNGPSKVHLNNIGNYVSGAWSAVKGCQNCADSLEFPTNVDEMPLVLLGVFIERPTPFLHEFLRKIVRLDYPKSRMALFVHLKTEYHKEEVDDFLAEHGAKYGRGLTLISPVNNTVEWHARNLALDECVRVGCDYYFSVDSNAHLDDSGVLRYLMAKDRAVIAPLVARSRGMWTNFWGALSSEGFYARSHDYVDIVKGNRRGIWNVPFVNEVYLVRAKDLIDPSIENGKLYPNYYRKDADPDMAFCAHLRENGVFMYVSNEREFGHLINPETFDISRKHPDLYEIYTNQKDWESRYIHENYSMYLLNETVVEQPCPDVYWFPVVSPIFCRHLIEVMEHFGKWSSGTNEDERLAGGYENVPTRDIHMNQVGFEQHWLYFLREYIKPLQQKVFIGYFHDPPKAIMNFVVRYHPNEQPSLRPHHDASTYTINIALNRVGIDFEGGGCRFIRYNCSVTNLRMGWTFMHPGRLTHYHEGLTVTKGTRYIMISFVDP